MELYETVDYFVVVEANMTHTGKPKRFIFEENKERYKQFLDKVIYVKVEDCPEYTPDNISIVENFQRNAIVRGLKGVAVAGDKILVSDLDEIPKAEAIAAHANKPGWIFFQPDLFYYYVNCQVVKPWGGTVMAEYESFKEPQQLRRFAKRHSRYVGESNETVITHAGWHYSYLTGGDPDKIRTKVENIYESSAILNLLGTREEVMEKMEKHLDPYGRELRKTAQSIVDISKTKPKAMDDFLKKYPEFFYREKKKEISAKETAVFIADKYNLDITQNSPFYINGGRSGLANLFKELGFTEGAEIGVYSGEYTEVLCRAIPGSKIFGVDAWEKYKGYFDVKGKQERYDRIYEQAKARLAPYDCRLIKKWSMDAVKDFADESLDFVYLDGNHDFSHVTEDIHAWEKKIKKGGIVSGHDFLRSNSSSLTIHVEDVVRAWTAAHRIHPWFVITGDEGCPSWMYIKN